jgi:hypothetical protein
MWLVGRLPQRSFVYFVSVYVLDRNLQPEAPPLIRFEKGELGIVGKYFFGLFSALSFDFPSHEITDIRVMNFRRLIASPVLRTKAYHIMKRSDVVRHSKLPC